MNPHLAQLQPYPFEKLRQLFAGITPNPALREIKLSIGEPQHATPAFIKEALSAGLGGLANYPTTLGSAALRQAIAAWMARRYGLDGIDAECRYRFSASPERRFSSQFTSSGFERLAVPFSIDHFSDRYAFQQPK